MKFHPLLRRSALATLALGGLLASPARAAAPAAPSNLEAIPLSSSSILLSWEDNSSNEDGFPVEMRNGGSFEQVGIAPPGATSVPIFGLEPATSYTFRIRACAAGECSAYSGEASAETFAEGPPVLPAAPSDLTAEALSPTEVLLSWTDNATNETDFRIEARSDGLFSEVTAAAPDATQAVAARLAPGTTYTFRVRAHNDLGFSPYSNEVTLTTPSEGSCTADARTLCLLDGRFRVRVSWVNQHAGGETGFGTAVSSTDQSGFFWFFGPDNIELVVKALDGRTVNGNFWFFYGALSDVEYTITVTDVDTGSERTYHNPPGRICGQGDTAAFPGGATAGVETEVGTVALPAVPFPDDVAAAASGSCQPDARTLCLQDGRFGVSVDWANQHADGATGLGTAVPRSEETGLFWFFGPDNIELVVKLLDARVVNGHFWFFYGGLSDVEYTIRVHDTVSGQVRTYHNDPGEICGAADTTAF